MTRFDLSAAIAAVAAPVHQERICIHRDYLNQFLTKQMALGDRLANIERDNIKLLHQDVFSELNCTIAERIAKRFYHSSAFDLGEPPKFFSGEFSNAAALFLARVYAARQNVGVRGIYRAAEDVHDAFVNAWLRGRAFGAESASNDALCKPWECVTSAVRKCEDIFICEAVRRMNTGLEGLVTGNVQQEAADILDIANYTLKREEPELCIGI